MVMPPRQQPTLLSQASSPTSCVRINANGAWPPVKSSRTPWEDAQLKPQRANCILLTGSDASMRIRV